MRERKDKLTPNHIRVYEKVLQSIHDDIKYEELDRMIADNVINSAANSRTAFFACFEAKPPNRGVSLRLIRQDLIGKERGKEGGLADQLRLERAV